MILHKNPFGRFKTPAVVCGLLVCLFPSWGCAPKAPSMPDYRVSASFSTGPANVVRAVRADGPFLWVGTNTGVLKINRGNGDLVKTYTKNDGLTSSYVFTIHLDRKGDAWFGTDAGGMMVFDGSNWKAYGKEDGMSDLWVYDMDFHPDGSMWVATWDGVTRYDPSAPQGSQFAVYNVTDGLVNKWVYGLAVDRDRSLWFGTEAGVNRFDPSAPQGKQWITYTQKDGLGAPNELALARKKTTGEAYESRQENTGVELAPGRSYAGHFHDLSVLDEAGKETYNENYIFAVLIDSRGDKWFGTWGGGVSRFDGKRWTNYTAKDGLSGNVVYALELDASGLIWVGTNHGLSSFNGKTWKSYTRSDGLIADDVYAVAIDPDRNVWIGQRGGVVQMGIQPAESTREK